MQNYNHVAGLKIVGEMLSLGANRVTLAGDVDQYGSEFLASPTPSATTTSG
jgi:hypothetical protein